MNPYKVLGVSEDATQDEIRTAYRELVKKYHPDQYANNPLSDLAQEKLKEINQAYDMLMSKQQGGPGDKGNTYRNGTGTVEFAQIREMIVRGDIQGAESALNAMGNRNAEWNYLYGVVCLRKGWYDQAREHMQRAVQMEPNNVEYRAGLNNINNMSFGYGRTYQRTAAQGDTSGLCNICGTLWCADCCCECMGGDFIPCC
ncbi:MAG: J domain-containing protein [Bacillota bacterium]